MREGSVEGGSQGYGHMRGHRGVAGEAAFTYRSTLTERQRPLVPTDRLVLLSIGTVARLSLVF